MPRPRQPRHPPISPDKPTSDPAATQTKTKRGRKSSYSAATATQPQGPPSLKIVLKRTRPSQDEDDQPPPPAAEASASPAITIDSTPAQTPSPSSSRSTSPFLPPPSAISTTAAATTTSSSGAPTRSRAPALVEPLASGPVNGKKGQKNGKDGLNRVCHHHKSQTDRPRMTCVMAPECRTVWCNVCIEKFYLICTPRGEFEAGGAFHCPVCLDICECAGCKRKRRGIGRDGVPETSKEGKKRGKKPKKDKEVEGKEKVKVKDKKEKKGKGRADPPVVKKSRSGGEGMGKSEALVMGLVGALRSVEEDEEDGGSTTEGDEDGEVQKMLGVEDDDRLAVKKRNSLMTAYDRANPSLLIPSPAPPSPPAAIALPSVQPPPPSPPQPSTSARAPAPAPPPPSVLPPTLTITGPAPPPAVASVPAPAPAPLPAAAPAPPKPRRKGGRPGKRAGARPPPRPPGPRPRQVTASSTTPDSPFVFGHPVPGVAPAAPISRPKRNKRPSTAFDDYAVDYSSAPSSVFNERTGGRARKHSNQSPATYGYPSYPSREEVLQANSSAAMLAKRKRYRTSGISSASSCDGLSSPYTSGDDSEDEAMVAREEEPLPVLAGLERNLGLESLEVEEGKAGKLLGDAFGVELVLPSPVEEEPRRSKIKWIEGPERKRRRAEAAAKAATGEEDRSEKGDVEVKVEDGDEVKPVSRVSETGHSPINAGEPLKPFGSPRLKKRTSLAPAPTTSTLSSLSSSTPSAALTSCDGAPPPYESHNPPAPPVRPASAPIGLDKTPSSTSATSASASLPPPQPADDLVNRSAADARLAFALLDAVRAAAAPRPSSGGEPNYGAAMSAALSVPMSATPSPTKPSQPSPARLVVSHPSAPSSTSSSTDLSSLDPLEAQRLEADRRRASLAATAVVDPEKAFKPFTQENAETQFFVSAVGASEDEMDVEMENDEDDGLGPSVSLRGTGGREDSPAVTTVPPLSAGGPATGTGAGFDFDPFAISIGSPLLVEDLWTPSSVAETSLSLCTSVSTTPSSTIAAGGGGGGGGEVGGGVEKSLQVEFEVEMEMDVIGLGEVMGWMEESGSGNGTEGF